MNNGEPWWISLIKAAVIVNLVMLAFAYTTWLERKLLGRMQNRYGPNRAGPFGLLQPFADLIKLVRKESFFPSAAHESLYIAAPVISGNQVVDVEAEVFRHVCLSLGRAPCPSGAS